MFDFKKYGLSPLGALPNERQLEWYKRERMIFFHFGMNTFTDKEWGDGTESPSTFNPTELDTRQWVKTVKEAGFTAAIITAKHHDGFCLWQTEYTEHSIKNSPYKNGKGDIVREFTDACAEYGIKAGIYLSPWDRHEPTWGKDEYNDFYVGQLTELLTNYGKIWECWWDGAGSTEAVYDWERWANTVRTLQPDAVIFGSLGATPWVDVRWVGNEKGIAGKPCYATIDPISLEVETTSELNSGKLDGKRFIPAEVDVSIRPGWFYHNSQDESVRSPENLVDLWFTSVGSNAGFLLNLPPDRRGLVHENDVRSLAAFNKTLKMAFENNLCDNCKIIADNARLGCTPEAVISEDDNYFYSPKDGCTAHEITVLLDGEKEFNTVTLREVNGAGHRITDIEISACVNGEWIILQRSKCVGNRLAFRTGTVVSDKIKIKVISALGEPLIYGFGIYMLKYEETNKKADNVSVNYTDDPLCKVEKTDSEIDINLGGVFPFNYVSVEGVKNCEYTLCVFNGSRFVKIIEGQTADGKICISLPEEIDYAYRIRITSCEKPFSNDSKITVKRIKQ
ncbi:MAG: alpha-L-fucosidase [Clostridia bacterium]|nr:alpha-L-fucosidase [Clostridia bacterium]